MIIGHQRQWNFLKKAGERGKISHTYLFSGQEKLGKKTVALEWISLLFGQSGSKLFLGGHPDFILITPDQKYSEPEQSADRGGLESKQSSGREQIQIGQIRDLNWRLSLKPFSAPLKTAIIDQAHLMNQAAQNCFLKTLEEPRGETLLILITEYPEFLLPTIRSRSEIIKFYPVPKKEIENYLKGQAVEEKKIQLISQISQGKPGKAIDFLCLPRKLKEREALLNEIIRLTKSDLTSRFQYAQKISTAPDLKEILNIWLTYFRENLIFSLDSKREPLEVAEPKFHYLPSKIRKLAKILEKIQETFFLISTTNVNPRLALETLMLEF